MPRLSISAMHRMPLHSFSGKGSTSVQAAPSSPSGGFVVLGGVAVITDVTSALVGALAGFTDTGSMMSFYLTVAFGVSLYALTDVPIQQALVAQLGDRTQLFMPAPNAVSSQPIYLLGNYLNVPYAMNSGPVITQAAAQTAGLAWLAVAADKTMGMAGLCLSLDSSCRVTYFAGTPVAS